MANPADPPAGPWIENPPWSGFDLLLLTCVVVFGIFFFTGISVGVLHGIYGKPLAELAGDPSVWMVVPAEGAAYVLMFAVLLWLAGSRRLRFWPALSWNWPQGFGWAGFLLVGFALAFVAGALQRVLPLPKELPIEKLFLQPGAPQVLALFGVMVAPFVEETFFRGLLYPVSNRWLREVVNSRQRLRRGRLIFLCLVPWGFVAQWRQPIGWMLLLVMSAQASAPPPAAVPDDTTLYASPTRKDRIGRILAPLGIQVAFTPLGIFVALVLLQTNPFFLPTKYRTGLFPSSIFSIWIMSILTTAGRPCRSDAERYLLGKASSTRMLVPVQVQVHGLLRLTDPWWR